ncbi:tartrate dehydrogenase [Xylaria nigripes]|nr:tartrate dehydrogenase [Xylaria nigripes]
MAPKPLKIAIIPGDGIGAEVMPYGVDCLQAIGDLYDIPLEFEEFDFTSVAYYKKHGSSLPPDVKTVLSPFDAIYVGAFGVSEGPANEEMRKLCSALVDLRIHFDQYVTLRPCRIIQGVQSPLADREPGEVDVCIVRGNDLGKCSIIGSMTDGGIETQETTFSHRNADRVLKYAFDLAQSRPRKRLATITESGGDASHSRLWESGVREMAKSYPDVKVDRYDRSTLAAHFVQKPDIFDVVVSSNNQLGEIQSDLGRACIGTLRIAPSASINPEGKFPSIFEHIHSSGPEIARKDIANPIGMIWAGQLLLQHFGHTEAADTLFKAVENVLVRSQVQVLTPDMEGNGTTQTLGEAIINEIVSFRK